MQQSHNNKQRAAKRRHEGKHMVNWRDAPMIQNKETESNTQGASDCEVTALRNMVQKYKPSLKKNTTEKSRRRSVKELMKKLGFKYKDKNDNKITMRDKKEINSVEVKPRRRRTSVPALLPSVGAHRLVSYAAFPTGQVPAGAESDRVGELAPGPGHMKMRRRYSVAAQTLSQQAYALSGKQRTEVLWEQVRHRLHRRKSQRVVRYGRFRRLVKFVILLLRVWRTECAKAMKLLENLDVLTSDLAHSGELMFDITDFKADKQARITQQSKEILRKLKDQRTEQELHHVRVALRNYSGLAEYPVKIQKLLAERAWFEEYDGRRVIVREGHPPMCFYFILSGSVVESVMDEDRKQARTVCYLGRGDSFGESELISKSPHPSTMVTKEKSQLLVLGDDDFYEIFMNGDLNNPEDPFLRSLGFLQGWPLELLSKNPEKALCRYVKRNTVVSKNTRESPWIYIIKSGSCSLLKEIAFSVTTGSRFLTNLDKSSVIQNTRRLPATESTNSRIMWKQTLDRLKRHTRRSYQSGEHTTPDNCGHRQQIQRIIERKDAILNKQRIRGRRIGLPEINIVTLPSYNVTTKPKTPLPPINQETHIEDHSEETSRSRDLLPKLQSKGPFYSSFTSHVDDVAEEKMSTGNSSDTNTVYIKGGSSVVAREKSSFIEVKTLTKGGVFGIADIIFSKQPCFSLVSNGAECIMIDKRFYMDHVPQLLMNKLRDETYPFPQDDILEANLRVTINWRHQKARTLQNTIHLLHNKKADIRDSRMRLKPILS